MEIAEIKDLLNKMNARSYCIESPCGRAVATD